MKTENALRLLSVMLIAVFLVNCAPTGPEQARQSGPQIVTADWPVSPGIQTAATGGSLLTDTGRDLLVTTTLKTPEQLGRLAEALADQYGLDFLAEWPISSLDVHCLVFRVASGTDQPTLIRDLENDIRVETVQAMQFFETLAQPGPETVQEIALTTDESAHSSLHDLQYSLAAINAHRAHRLATGRGVRIAIIDTGIDATHPDLAKRIIVSKNFISDGLGENVAENHGTAIAGVIGAGGDTRDGIVGVSPAADLLSLRGCWQDAHSGKGQCSSFTLARALNFAIVQDADIINLSLGGPRDPLLERLIDAALARGVTVIAARRDIPGEGFPAAHHGVVAVAMPAAAEDTAFPDESREQVIYAPGTDIITTTPNRGYEYFTGSSLSTAHVSGIVALILERRPDIPPHEMMALLHTSSVTGSGIVPYIDACQAVLNSLKSGYGPENRQACQASLN